MIIYKTLSSSQTKKIANLLFKELSKSRLHKKNALVIALSGDLGAGKTTFTQGFLKAGGIKKKIASPTFVLMKKFKVKGLRFKTIYHIDCYRIKKSSELIKLGLKEILNEPGNIVLIEWAEKIRRILPKNTIWIRFQYGNKEDERIINLRAQK